MIAFLQFIFCIRQTVRIFKTVVKNFYHKSIIMKASQTDKVVHMEIKINITVVA